MVSSDYRSVVSSGGDLTYAAADMLAGKALRVSPGDTIVVDLAGSERATTAGLARLVALRRRLRVRGRDLRLLGLHGQTKQLYHIYRMDNLLPQARQIIAS